MRPHSSNRYGQSLVSVMVGAAAFGIVTLGTISMMNVSNRSAQSTKASVEFNTLISSIQMATGNATICPRIFSPFSFVIPSGASLPISISPPQTVSPMSNQGVIIAKVAAMPSSALKVTKIEFDKVLDNTLPDSNGKHQVLVNLHLEADKVVGGGVLGNASLSADFPILLQTNLTTNAIVGCQGTTAGPPIPPVCVDSSKALHWTGSAWSCDFIIGSSPTPSPSPSPSPLPTYVWISNQYPPSCPTGYAFSGSPADCGGIGGDIFNGYASNCGAVYYHKPSWSSPGCGTPCSQLRCTKQ